MALEPGAEAQFKTDDARSYDALGEEFDRFEALRAPLLGTLLAQLDLAGSERVLDVGAGTGIVALEAARRMNADGAVVGVDLSEGLLERARRKAVAAGLGRKACFLKMDAEALALRDQSFDAVVSLFALLHFPNPERALAEMVRVLRPGGKVVIAVGSGPSWLSLQGWLHRMYRSGDLWAQATGRLLTAPRFLDSLLNEMFPARLQEETELAAHSKIRAGGILALMRNAGVTALESHWHAYEEAFTDAQEFWLLQRVYSSIARKRLNALPPQDQAAVQQAFLDRCESVRARGGRLTYPYAAFVARGLRAREA